MLSWSIRNCPENEMHASFLAALRLHRQNRNNQVTNPRYTLQFPNDAPNHKIFVKKHIKYRKSIESSVLCKKKQLYYDLS